LPKQRPAFRATRRRGRIARRILLVLAVLIVVLAIAAGGGWYWLRGRMEASLPQLDGERALAGLSAPVEIERDDLGVPTIRAASRVDAARALGFLHAQDRFFQMDLLRRQAAGELAEVFGPAAVEVDKEHRVHRFRDVARRVVAMAPGEDRAVLEAYAAGVNAGLAALGSKPFEYVAMRADPAPWQMEDSILAVHAMFIELNDENGTRESNLGVLHAMLPAEMFELLAPKGTEWDAPIEGRPFVTPPIPRPEVFNLRRGLPQSGGQAAGKAAAFRPESPDESTAALGSNNWAVAGTHTADGRALLANDMHLGIRVPNTWYRVSIVRPANQGANQGDNQGGSLRLTGVSLPGTPMVAVGSNGHVAWGFTNSYGDWTDLVVLERTDARDPDLYRTPEGPKRLRTVQERIRVKGKPDETLAVKESVWGPVIDNDAQGRPRALAWTAHYPEAVNLRSSGLETARNLEEAMAVANRSGIPPQNFVVADSTGRIGWTIMGQIPRRLGFDGRVPVSWADGSHRWAGWLAPEEFPRVVDPSSGRIWTANSRVVEGAMLARLGDGGYDLGARAKQIRDDLVRLDRATPKDLLAIQLDDRALFLERWRGVLMSALTPQALSADPRRRDLKRLIQLTWTGRASVDSVAYRLVRSFRANLQGMVFTALTGQGDKPEAERFGPTPQFEGPLWRIVNERPLHLLDPKYQSWDEQILAAVDAVFANLEKQGTPELAGRTWGERNTTRIQHPLSQAVPGLSRWLDMPAHPLPGDENMPRVQGVTFGASERLVVSPGHEEEGFFHMPVGQSGHPLSPYYRKGHEAWEKGEPTPFLPGPAVHRLRLTPGR
jgi:penicillin amidase